MRTAKAIELRSTIHVESMSSFLVGHETLRSSTKTSEMKFLICATMICRNSAGQAGVEPATFGFGDRRSTNWSYWPIVLFFCFLVRSVLSAKPAVFLGFYTLGLFLFIFGVGIGDTVARRALKMDNFSHCKIFLGFKVKAPDRYRTGDLVLTKDVLYRLSYRGRKLKIKVYGCATYLSRLIFITNVLLIS